MEKSSDSNDVFIEKQNYYRGIRFDYNQDVCAEGENDAEGMNINFQILFCSNVIKWSKYWAV